jgi:L-2-hydroxyglutarate oxidase LhgO
MKGVPKDAIPPTFYAIGHYYRLSGKAPASHLIYPIPENGGLGVHLTLDLGGQAKFGPDVRWIDSVDYSFDDSRFDAFVGAIHEYLPSLDEARLSPDYTGIRPKIVSQGKAAADFRTDDASVHGFSGLINLFGIESPGLTSALAIGEYVADRVMR